MDAIPEYAALLPGYERCRFEGESRTSIVDLGMSGKSAIVTVSSGGLGEFAARALAAEGVNLALFTRSADTLRANPSLLPDPPSTGAWRFSYQCFSA